MSNQDSKSTSIWWPRYVGDYQRKTAHLTLAEHGAYTLLLDHYYATSKPLPANASVLHRICRAFAPDEQQAVQSVIDQFFTLTEDGYHNKKADEQLSKRGEISEKRKRAAEKRHSKPDANAPANAYANACPIAPTSTSTSTSTVIVTTKDNIPPDGFDEFWKVYPKRMGKGAARKSYAAAVKKADPERIISAAKAFASLPETKKENYKFCPYPATWLNQERWADEPVTVKRVPLT